MLADLARVQDLAAEGDAEHLIEFLSGSSLLIRHAAHVELMAMSGGAGILTRFDAFADPASQKSAVQAWREMVKKGQVNGPGRVRVYQQGKLVKTPPVKKSAQELARYAINILSMLLSESGRVEAIEAIIPFLDMDAAVAQHTLMCLKAILGVRDIKTAAEFRSYWQRNKPKGNKLENWKKNAY